MVRGKRALTSASAPPALPGQCDPDRWLATASGIQSRFCPAIASAQALLDKAQQIGQRWLVVRRVALAPM